MGRNPTLHSQARSLELNDPGCVSCHSFLTREVGVVGGVSLHHRLDEDPRDGRWLEPSKSRWDQGWPGFSMGEGVGGDLWGFFLWNFFSGA